MLNIYVKDSYLSILLRPTTENKVQNFKSINQIIDQLKRAKTSYDFVITYLQEYKTLDVRPDDEDEDRSMLIIDLEALQALFARILNEVQTRDAEYDAFMCDKIAHEEGLAIEAKYGWNPNDISPF